MPRASASAGALPPARAHASNAYRMPPGRLPTMPSATNRIESATACRRGHADLSEQKAERRLARAETAHRDRQQHHQQHDRYQDEIGEQWHVDGDRAAEAVGLQHADRLHSDGGKQDAHQLDVMVRVAAHGVGHRRAGALHRPPRQPRHERLRQRRRAIAEDRRANDRARERRRDERHDDGRTDVGARAEDDGNGADKRDRRARRARGPSGPTPPTPRAARRVATGCRRDTRRRRCSAETMPTNVLTKNVRRTMANGGREPGVSAHSRSIQRQRHQRAIDEDQQDRGAEPADSARAVVAQDVRGSALQRMNAVRPTATAMRKMRRRKSSGPLLETRFLCRVPEPATYLVAGSVSRCRSGWRFT